MKHKKLYDKRAKDYDFLMGIIGYNFALERILMQIPLEIPNDAKILDLGCGTGLASIPLLKRLPKSEIFGLDFSEEMIKKYNNIRKTKSIVGDFNDEKTFRSFPNRQKIQLPDSYFDLIISTGALSEYGNLEEALPLVYSKLKNNGILMNVGINKNIVSDISGAFWQYKTPGRKNFMDACDRHGFKEVKRVNIPMQYFPNNYWRYIVKARK